MMRWSDINSGNMSTHPDTNVLISHLIVSHDQIIELHYRVYHKGVIPKFRFKIKVLLNDNPYKITQVNTVSIKIPVSNVSVAVLS